MNVKRWFKERFQNGSTRTWEHALTDDKASGDFRGPYGFGRRAHRPDPQASYSFGDDPTHRMTHPEPSHTGRWRSS